MTIKKYTEPLEYLFGAFHRPLNTATRTAYEIEFGEKGIDARLVYQTAKEFVRVLKRLPESADEFCLEAMSLDGRKKSLRQKSTGCDWCEEGKVFYFPCGVKNKTQPAFAWCSLCRVDSSDTVGYYVDPSNPKIVLDYVPKIKTEEEVPF